MTSNILVILHESFAPYHLAMIDAATRFCKNKNLRIVGIEIASHQTSYPWKKSEGGYIGERYTLFAGKSLVEVPSISMVSMLWSLLNRLDPQAISICGYNSLPMLAALAWVRLNHRVAVFNSDSKYDDYPRTRFKEWIKSRILSWFDVAFASGSLSRSYLETLGMSPSRIFIGANVVDNDYFATQAYRARENVDQLRIKYRVPENFFLCVSRFINGKGKNISRLLEAYAQYCQESKSQPWGLVLCGSGPLEAQLRREAEQLGLHQVYFAGFRQMSELPIYYGLARCLIIPSLGDTWSLAVNEAMASGLPVLVSRACGCVRDLVRDGVNGYAFDPLDVAAMVQLMLEISSGKLNLKAMGKASRQIIAEWSPETYVKNFIQAIHAAMTHHRKAFNIY